MGNNDVELVLTDDDSGVFAVSLVDKPAIAMNWVAMAQPDIFKFSTISEEKRIIAGPVLLADTPIQQAGGQGLYNAFITPATIEQVVQRFHKNGFQSNVTMQHSSDYLPEGVFMYQSFIINRSLGINPPTGFEAMKDGSWFAFYKVDNEDVWNNYVKRGLFKGFSIEGLFGTRPVQFSEDELSVALKELISAINTNIKSK